MTTGTGQHLDAVAYSRLTELADYVVPFAIRVACDLGVADLLVNGPRSVAELAAATNSDAPSLQRMLRALASRGIFTELEDNQFALTALADSLRSDHPLSLRAAYPLLAAEVRAWAQMRYTLRTGAPAFDLVHGRPYWDHYAVDRAEGARVDALQAAATALHLRTVAAAFDWASLDRIIDVGGGNGAFLAGLLRRHSGLRGVVFDRPEVVAAAPAVLHSAGVWERCDVMAGNFFDSVPSGGNYLLKTVLAGWDDENAIALLRVLRTAMTTDSRLVVLEAVLPPGDEFDVGKIFDVQTLVMTGGGHRDRAGLDRLFAEGGLRIQSVTPTASLAVVVACAT